MKKEEWAQFLLCSLSLALLSFLSQLWYARVDMSYGQFYSLSKYTKDVFESLDGVAEISWFRSSSFLAYAPKSGYILDILNEMKICGGEKCVFRIYNAETMDEKKLLSLNLVPQNIEEKKAHEVAVKNIYSGIVVRLKGFIRTIPFVASASNLEYEIVNLILQINRESENIERGINLLFASGEEEAAPYLAQWLSYAGFKTRELSLPLKDELDLSYPLFVVGSSKIDEGSATFIDVFLKKGGKAAFFVSGNTVDVAGNWEARKKSGDALIQLLSEYGILIESDLVLDISNFPLKMLSSDGASSQTINYPLWPTLLYENLDSSFSVFASIFSLQTFWPSSIELNKEKNETLQPLATSTQQSITMEKDYITDPFSQNIFQLFQKEKGEKRILMAIAKKPTKMVVVSDENIIGRAIEYTNAQENMEFALNLAFYLSENEEILRLREKRHDERPFRFYEEDEFNSILAKARIFCFLILPSLIIAFYIFIRKKNG